MSFIKDLITAYKAVKHPKPETKGAYSMWNMQTAKSPVSLSVAFRNWSGVCINLRARSFAQIKTIVTDKNGNEITAPEILKITTRPNLYQTWYELKEMALKWRDFTGNAYIWTPLDTTVPTQAYVLPSKSVTVVMNSASFGAGIAGYEYTNSQGTKVFLRKEEICHIRSLQPSDEELSNFILGSAVELNAAADAVLIEDEKMTFLYTYLKSDAVPPFVVKTPDELDVVSWNDFKQRLNAVLPQTYKVAAILDGGKEIVPLTNTSGNNAIVGANIDTEILQIITAAFGVPMGLLTGNFQNRSTAEVNREFFYTNTIEPLLHQFEASLSSHFGQWFEGIRFSHQQETFADPAVYAEQLQYAHSAGAIDNVQFLRAIGYSDDVNE